MDNYIYKATINMLGLYSNRFFTVNLKQQPLSPERQFGISLGQMLGQYVQLHYNTLYARGIKKFKREALQNNWGIYDGFSAHNVLSDCLESGIRESYNYIVDLFLKTKGDVSKLKDNENYPYHDENYSYYVEHFKNLNFVLKMRAGKYWFPNPEEDFKVMCDAFDIGRMINVCRMAYTVGYITEEEAWDYIDKYSAMALERFSNWRDYAKSYMLGRATWNGNRNMDFEAFSRVTKRLVTSKNSPWVKFGWLCK